MSSDAMPAMNVLGNMANSMWNDMMLSRDEKRRWRMGNAQMRLQYNLNRQLAQNAASDAVQGYKAAGVSPALASAGKFTTQSVSPTAGPASGGASAGPVDFASVAQMLSSAKLADAEASKASEDARATKISNDNAEAANKAVRSRLSAMASEILRTPKDKPRDVVNFAVDILQNSDLLSRGYMQGLGDYLAWRRNHSKASEEQVENAFWQDVWTQRNDDSSIASAVADLPAYDKEKLLKEIEYTTTQIARLESDQSLDEQRRDMLLQQIEQSKASMEKIISSDVSGNFSRGEYTRGVLELVVMFVEALGAAVGLRFGKGVPNNTTYNTTNIIRRE